MTPEVQSAFALSSISVPVTFALSLAACVYLRGWLRLRSTVPNVISDWQLVSFMTGMVALWIALGSPLRAFHQELLTIHMVDHVLLMAVAAPLILLGGPFRSFAHGLPQRFVREGLARYLCWSPVQRLGRVLGHPMFCWLAATVALIGWHVPVAFELGMRSDGWHEVEYACFFLTGLLFWWPVIRPWPNVARGPRWSIVLYLFFATLPCDVLSAFLTFCDRVVYPCYLSGNRHFSISPLQDQESAGALMWVSVTFVYLVAAVVITTQLLFSPSAHTPNPVPSDLPHVTATGWARRRGRLKMATESSIAALEVAAAQRGRLVHSKVLADYWALTKPEVNFLIVITTFAGFCLARSVESHPFPFLMLMHTLVGALLLASGAGALNQFVERRFDAQMRRTARRPLVAGRVEPVTVLWFGILLSCAGAVYLAMAVNALASLLATLTLLSYLFLYTPLKRRTPLCTVVGAFPGAMPPLIGWAAASGRLSFDAWVLFGVLFLWQFPHFMAIAWMYREDYDRAGYLVLPRGSRRIRFMAWQSLLPALALIPLGLIPGFLGRAGSVYTMGTVLLGSYLSYWGAQLAFRQSNGVARRLLLASIIYLPFEFVLMVLDKA